MKRLMLLVLPLLLGLGTSSALSDDSFRTAEGDLIQTGMSKMEVLDVLGPPETEELPSEDIDLDLGTGTIESWTYRLEGSIGGPYLVRVVFDGGEVRELRAEALE